MTLYTFADPRENGAAEHEANEAPKNWRKNMQRGDGLRRIAED
jgi:hypothetical protein